MNEWMNEWMNENEWMMNESNDGCEWMNNNEWMNDGLYD